MQDRTTPDDERRAGDDDDDDDDDAGTGVGVPAAVPPGRPVRWPPRVRLFLPSAPSVPCPSGAQPARHV